MSSDEQVQVEEQEQEQEQEVATSTTIPLQFPSGKEAMLRANGGIWHRKPVFGGEVLLPMTSREVVTELEQLGDREGQYNPLILEYPALMQSRPPKRWLKATALWLAVLFEDTESMVVVGRMQDGRAWRWYAGLPEQEVTGATVDVDDFMPVRQSMKRVFGARATGTLHIHPGGMATCSTTDATDTWRDFGGIHWIVARSGIAQGYLAMDGAVWELPGDQWRLRLWDAAEIKAATKARKKVKERTKPQWLVLEADKEPKELVKRPRAITLVSTTKSWQQQREPLWGTTPGSWNQNRYARHGSVGKQKWGEGEPPETWTKVEEAAGRWGYIENIAGQLQDFEQDAVPEKVQDAVCAAAEALGYVAAWGCGAALQAWEKGERLEGQKALKVVEVSGRALACVRKGELGKTTARSVTNLFWDVTVKRWNEAKAQQKASKVKENEDG